MGLLNLIPPDNQLSQMLMGLQQPLNDLGVGLTRGKTWQKGLREASNYTEEQAPLRAKMAQEKLQADTEANTRNSTAAWLRTQPGGEKFAAALENGMIDGSTAFKSWLDASKAPEMTANMRDWQFAQENPGYADFLSPTKPGSLPTSYQEYQLAQSDPAYAAQLNSSTSRPLTEGQRRNQQLGSVVEPLVGTVIDNWAELTDPKNQAIGFDTPVGAPGFAMTSEGYQKATNALKTIAQSYLYSVSGAAATDAETKKIVDSVTPKFGESEASANEKKALLARYVKAIIDAGGGQQPGGGQPAAGGDADVENILNGLGI